MTEQGNYVTMLYENGQLDTFWFYDVACVKTLFDIVQSVIVGGPTVRAAGCLRLLSIPYDQIKSHDRV